MCNIPHFTCTHKNFLEHTPPFTHMELVKKERVERSRTKIENFIYGEMVVTHEREVYFLFYFGLFLCQHIDVQSSMWVKGGVGMFACPPQGGVLYKLYKACPRKVVTSSPL